MVESATTSDVSVPMDAATSRPFGAMASAVGVKGSRR
ncbi:MAG: hypothetical protein RLZZ97_777, partial [Gemmatimonadota bacterium]